MFRKLRIAILLFILATVAVGSWKSSARSSAWDSTLHVTVYPIAADPSDTSRRIVADLKPEDFTVIGDWLEDELQRHGHSLLRPLAINLAPPLNSQPPPFPAGGNALAMMGWSLQLRFWAWRHDAAPGPRPDVRLFLLYHDPALTPSLDHSVGLEKGKLGVVKVFASRSERQRNAVVIAHELLHTLGATDKYDLHSLAPRFPDGYAEPQRQPLYPQPAAEIMAGRIPLADDKTRIPDKLAQTLIGPLTASEIGLPEAHQPH
ncbi:MAG: hypothetical protein JSR83_14745 [Proteobacteria bacterium]|nr:hypothetical protein [Pseudomonadota bacterium]